MSAVERCRTKKRYGYTLCKTTHSAIADCGRACDRISNYILEKKSQRLQAQANETGKQLHFSDKMNYWFLNVRAFLPFA
jgi:hypothetical protein